jgi:hypothetical protein
MTFDGRFYSLKPILIERLYANVRISRRPSDRQGYKIAILKSMPITERIFSKIGERRHCVRDIEQRYGNSDPRLLAIKNLPRM